MSEHTPLPWLQVKLHPNCILGFGQKGNESFSVKPDSFTAKVSPKEAQARVEANAALIVHRVNAFDDLLAALKACVQQIRALCSEDDIPDGAKAAIAAAENRATIKSAGGGK